MQNDIMQYKGAFSQLKLYRENDHLRILWTNVLFAGTPTYIFSTFHSCYISRVYVAQISDLSENLKNEFSKDYEFSNSSQWTDLDATITPGYNGGDSEKTGLHYGDIGSTLGPKYTGVTMLILTVLGLFLINEPIKWWLVPTILLTIVLSKGSSHFTRINSFMYEYFLRITSLGLIV